MRWERSDAHASESFIAETLYPYPEGLVIGVGIQGLRDEGFGSVRPVAVGGVEEIDAELKRPMQQQLRCARISRRAPDVAAVGGHAHCAETHAAHDELAELQRS